MIASGPSTVDLVLMYFMFVILLVGWMPGVTRRLVVGTHWLVVSGECRKRACMADRAAEEKSAQGDDQSRDHR
jgi:hypothetical protein